MNNFQFSLLQRDDYNDVLDITSQAFCRYDPIEIALEISPREFKQMLSLELPVLLQSNLSCLARNDQTQALSGLVLANDARAEHVDSRQHISPKFIPVSQMVGELYDDYLSERDYQSGEALYIFILAVAPNAMGQGLGKALIKHSLNHATRMGYQTVFTIATNNASLGAFSANQFQTVKQRDYQQFQYQNEFVFSGITDHPGIALMQHDL